MSNCCSGSCQSQSSNDDSNVDQPLSGKFASEFILPKMDCPSEERMVRLVLENIKPQVGLVFDLAQRKLTVYHDDNLTQISKQLDSLNYGAQLLNTRASDLDEVAAVAQQAQAHSEQEFSVLRTLLFINGLMFFVEIFIGFWAQSTGLIADSLDMLADAAVYGLAIVAVGATTQKKLRIAHLSGYIQMLLALGALSEVIRRFIYGSEPLSTMMIAIGLLALVANVACLFLIYRKKDSGAHMQASWIFSANDVIANVGVIIAGMLVAYTGSPYPDLIIGSIIALVVLNGARSILKLKS